MFCIRPRRYYKKDVYEIWSMEHNNGEGFIAEDVLVIKFEENYIKALLIVKEATRADIDEYNSYVYALFDDLVDDSAKVDLKIIIDETVQEYWPEKLIEKLE